MTTDFYSCISQPPHVRYHPFVSAIRLYVLRGPESSIVLACIFFFFWLQELSLKTAEVEKLLIDLILDRRLNGKIDQIEGFLLLDGPQETATSRKHDAMERWSNSLRSLSSFVAARVEC